ncbi:MAG: hypothetical protein LKE61_09060 [Erysipelotrichaceae bacterium]|jgi:hypothetical protein|nr:hypothetical protein [Erysipelotrichaceae bacterium]
MANIRREKTATDLPKENGHWPFHQFLLTIGVDQHAKQRRNFENKQ